MTQEIAIGSHVRIEFGQHWSNASCAWCRGQGVRRDLARCECVTWRAARTHEGKVLLVDRQDARSAIVHLDSRMVPIDREQEFRIVTLKEGP